MLSHPVHVAEPRRRWQLDQVSEKLEEAVIPVPYTRTNGW